jgi:hypothetical protein
LVDKLERREEALYENMILNLVSFFSVPLTLYKDIISTKATLWLLRKKKK